jgi:hypothetical protein
VPKNGTADISLPVGSDAALVLSGKGTLCFHGGLKARRLTANIASFNMEILDLVISSETFSTDRIQHISGTRKIESGVLLDIG